MTSYLRRITPSMAVAILAIVIAVSSSATAALVISGKQIKDHSITGKDLKKNAVKSKTIKNKTVRGKDLKKGAVKSATVLDHSLTGSDLRAGTVTGKEIADGTITSSNLSTTLLQTLNSGASGFQVVTGPVGGSGAAPRQALGVRLVPGGQGRHQRQRLHRRARSTCCRPRRSSAPATASPRRTPTR